MSGSVVEHKVGIAATIVVVLAILVTIAAMIFVPFLVPEARAAEILKDGLAWAKQGDYPRAEALFAHAIRENPRNADAHFNHGMVLLGMSRTAEACQRMYNAIQLEAANAEFRLEYGRCLIIDGKVEDGARSVKQAAELGFCDMTRIESDPSYTPARGNPSFDDALKIMTGRCR